MKHLKIIWILGTLLLLISCKCTHVTILSQSRFIKTDSIVHHLLGDSLEDILFTPKTVSVYTLTPKDAPQKVAGYAVDSLLYSFKSEDLSVFQYSFLCDTLNYRTLHTIRAPFTPALAFEFVKDNSNVYLVFSFQNREWRILKGDTTLKSFVYQSLSLEPFFTELLPNYAHK